MRGIEGLLAISVVRSEIEARESRDVASGKRGSMLSAKDLKTEVKRELSRASSDLSLLDSFQRDGTLCKYLIWFLHDFDSLDIVDTIVETACYKRKLTEGPEPPIVVHHD